MKLGYLVKAIFCSIFPFIEDNSLSKAIFVISCLISTIYKVERTFILKILKAFNTYEITFELLFCFHLFMNRLIRSDSGAAIFR